MADVTVALYVRLEAKEEMEKADELLSETPRIEQVDVLASKLPG